MKAVSLLAFSLFFGLANVQAHEGPLTNAKVAELASHRIGRLVDTGKIDESFVKNLSSLEVELIHGKPEEPAYKVKASQPENDKGEKSVTELSFDAKGKFMSNKVLGTAVPTNSPDWSEADPVELVESVLHFVTEKKEDEVTVDLKPFNKKMKKLQVKQKVNDDGSKTAVVTLTSTATAKSLEFNLSLTGEILNYSVID